MVCLFDTACGACVGWPPVGPGAGQGLTGHGPRTACAAAAALGAGWPSSRLPSPAAAATAPAVPVWPPATAAAVRWQGGAPLHHPPPASAAPPAAAAYPPPELLDATQQPPSLEASSGAAPHGPAPPVPLPAADPAERSFCMVNPEWIQCHTILVESA